MRAEYSPKHILYSCIFFLHLIQSIQYTELNTSKFTIEGTRSNASFLNIFDKNPTTKYTSSSETFNFFVTRFDQPYKIDRVEIIANNLRKDEQNSNFSISTSSQFRLCDKPWSFSRFNPVQKDIAFSKRDETITIFLHGREAMNLIFYNGSPYDYAKRTSFVVSEVIIYGCCQDLDKYSNSEEDYDPLRSQIYPVVHSSMEIKEKILNGTDGLYMSKNIFGLVPISSGQFCLISLHGKCSTIVGRYKEKVGGYLISSDVRFWSMITNPKAKRFHKHFSQLLKNVKDFFECLDCREMLIESEQAFNSSSFNDVIVILAESSSTKLTKQARYMLYNEIPFLWLVDPMNSEKIDYTLNGFDIILNQTINHEDQYFILNKVTKENLFAVEDILRAVDYNTRSWIGLKPSDQTLHSKKAKSILNYFNFPAILEKYSDDFEKFLPCPERPLAAGDKNSGIISFLAPIRNLFLENNRGIEFPGALEYPGDVNPNVAPIKLILDVYSNFTNEIIYLGVAVKPSSPWRFRVLDGSKGDWKFMIGCSPEVIRKRDYFIRHVEIHRYVSLDEANMDNYHEFGGVLSLINLKNSQNKITIELEGVYHTALFDSALNNTEEVWNLTKETTGASQAILKGENHIVCVPLRLVYSETFTRLNSSMNLLSKLVKLLHNFSGSSYRSSRREIVSMERQTSHGLAHSGYPWIAKEDWMATLLKASDGEVSRLEGFCHEIGHLFQHERWFLPGTEESSNIFFCDVAYKYIYPTSLKGRRSILSLSYIRQDDKEHMFYFWKHKIWPFTNTAGQMYFRTLAIYLGEGVLSNTISRMIHTNNTEYEHDMITKWNLILSQEAQYDLTVLNLHFNMPVNVSSQVHLRDLKCWIIKDYPYRDIYYQMYSMGKKMGKSCVTRKWKVPFAKKLDEGFEENYSRLDVVYRSGLLKEIVLQ